jgi:hypothetical protein
MVKAVKTSNLTLFSSFVIPIPYIRTAKELERFILICVGFYNFYLWVCNVTFNIHLQVKLHAT